MLLHPQTFFLVQRYNPLRRIQWPKVKVTNKGQIVIKMDEKHETTGCYFIHRLLTSILTSIISAFCDSFGRCHLVCIVYCPMTHFSLDGWTNAVRHVKNPRLPPQTSLDLLFSCMYCWFEKLNQTCVDLLRVFIICIHSCLVKFKGIDNP